MALLELKHDKTLLAGALLLKSWLQRFRDLCRLKRTKGGSSIDLDEEREARDHQLHQRLELGGKRSAAASLHSLRKNRARRSSEQLFFVLSQDPGSK